MPIPGGSTSSLPGSRPHSMSDRAGRIVVISGVQLPFHSNVAASGRHSQYCFLAPPRRKNYGAMDGDGPARRPTPREARWASKRRVTPVSPHRCLDARIPGTRRSNPHHIGNVLHSGSSAPYHSFAAERGAEEYRRSGCDGRTEGGPPRRGAPAPRRHGRLAPCSGARSDRG